MLHPADLANGWRAAVTSLTAHPWRLPLCQAPGCDRLPDVWIWLGLTAEAAREGVCCARCAVQILNHLAPAEVQRLRVCTDPRDSDDPLQIIALGRILTDHPCAAAFVPDR